MTQATELEVGSVHRGARVTARAQTGEVGISSFEMAQQAGMRGRLVPNTLHFAQLNELLLDLLGLDWLEGGQIEVQYRAPLYDGDELAPVTRVASNELAGGGGLEFEVWCENQDGQNLARGTARWCPRDTAWTEGTQ